MFPENGDRYLGLLERSVGDEPPVVAEFPREGLGLSLAARDGKPDGLSGPRFSGDADPGNFRSLGGSPHAVDHLPEAFLNGFENFGLDRNLPDGLGLVLVIGFSVLPINAADDKRFPKGAAVRRCRDEVGRLEGGEEVKALADRNADRFAGIPFLLEAPALPGVGSDEPALFVGVPNPNIREYLAMRSIPSLLPTV